MVLSTLLQIWYSRHTCSFQRRDLTLQFEACSYATSIVLPISIFLCSFLHFLHPIPPMFSNDFRCGYMEWIEESIVTQYFFAPFSSSSFVLAFLLAKFPHFPPGVSLSSQFQYIHILPHSSVPFPQFLSLYIGDPCLHRMIGSIIH